MNHIHKILIASTMLLASVLGGCSSNAKTDEHSDDRITNRGEHDGERGEHDRDGEGHHGKEGEKNEESGTELALNQTYDQVRNGARLILAYNAKSNSFNGTVENTTKKLLKRVRVEVHLSNGKELGPTIPGDLNPGEKRDITLAATSKGFERWNAHPEVGSGEHGHGKGRGEHDREGGREHEGKRK